eukprot:13747807-Ditylum_brightwellii.AAC.1
MHFSAKHEARDDLGCVATQAISPYAVRNNPRIQPSQDTKRKDARVANQTQKSEAAEVQVIKRKDKDNKGNLYERFVVKPLLERIMCAVGIDEHTAVGKSMTQSSKTEKA